MDNNTNSILVDDDSIRNNADALVLGCAELLDTGAIHVNAILDDIFS